MNKDVIIKPKKGISNLDIEEIFEFKELFFVLALREFQVRYKQTLIGVLWAILRPLLTMVVFTFLFGTIAKLPSDGVPYPVFSYAGLLIWTFFSTALSASSSSMIVNSKLITKIYFPRVIIPISSTIVSLIDYAIAFVILLGLMLYYKILFTYTMPIFLLSLLVSWILSIGLGLWFSAINVKYRDVQYALPFLIQLIMYATPVIYPVSIAGKYQWILSLNPMSGLVEMHRSALLGGVINWELFGISLGITFVIFITGYLYFKSVEKYFADII